MIAFRCDMCGNDLTIGNGWQLTRIGDGHERAISVGDNDEWHLCSPQCIIALAEQEARK